MSGYHKEWMKCRGDFLISRENKNSGNLAAASPTSDYA